MGSSVLHSGPHGVEFDRLMDKIDHGRKLTDAEFMFASEWLHEINTDSSVTAGERTAAGILLALLNSKYRRLKESHIDF
jgi:hypothetical protein